MMTRLEDAFWCRMLRRVRALPWSRCLGRLPRLERLPWPCQVTVACKLALLLMHSKHAKHMLAYLWEGLVRSCERSTSCF